MLSFTFNLIGWLRIQQFGIFLLDIFWGNVCHWSAMGSERAWGQKAGMGVMTAENMLWYEGSCRCCLEGLRCLEPFPVYSVF